MKRVYSILKPLLTSCLLLSLVFALSSCGSKANGYTVTGGVYKNDSPIALAVILGRHANAMAIPQDAYNSIEDLLDRAVYGGYVCAVIADATPMKIDLVDGKEYFQEDARNPVILNQRISTRRSEIIAKLKDADVSANSPEVDLLAAIREAKNALSNSQANNISNKQIVIIDTGISTTGDLNFVDIDFLYSKPKAQDIIEQLRSYENSGVLPDLAGITVTFVGTADGLAEVAKPQEASTTDKKFIRELWTGVVQACGANDVKFEAAAGWGSPNLYTEDTDSKFPYVSVISFSHDKVISFPELPTYDPNNPDSQPNLPKPPSVEVRLASEMVGFMPDRADYLNEENVRRSLRPFANELNEFFKHYPNEKIWIVGTTAAVQKGSNGSVDLSLKRAEMVKHTLVEFGISSDRLLTIGLGAKFPWHVDEFPNGVFDTNVAQANRAVWLLTAQTDTDKFSKLKSAYDSSDLLPEAISRFSLLYQ
ncbi:MAG: OmpA family protein [Oscillospiraceae bacterium]|nr:OmpA family protein [Oscillospiraceae bacterium]